MITLPLSTRISQSLSAFTRNLKQRRVYRQLSTMDAHLLKDIGLTPADVEGMRRNW
jgi:uncharacterized protein YjiS (DUF1127 family)